MTQYQPIDPWWQALWLLLAAVVITLGVKGYAWLQTPVDEWAQAPTRCDLRQHPCTATFADGGWVELAITPAGIPLVHPLQLEVRLAHMGQPDRVELDFRGVDMAMGYNRVLLAPGAHPEHFVGTGRLPVCVRERMLWEARVLLYSGERTRAAAFRFET